MGVKVNRFMGFTHVGFTGKYPFYGIYPRAGLRDVRLDSDEGLTPCEGARATCVPTPCEGDVRSTPLVLQVEDPQYANH